MRFWGLIFFLAAEAQAGCLINVSAPSFAQSLEQLAVEKRTLQQNEERFKSLGLVFGSPQGKLCAPTSVLNVIQAALVHQGLDATNFFESAPELMQALISASPRLPQKGIPLVRFSKILTPFLNEHFPTLKWNARLSEINWTLPLGESDLEIDDSTLQILGVDINEARSHSVINAGIDRKLRKMRILDPYYGDALRWVPYRTYGDTILSTISVYLGEPGREDWRNINEVLHVTSSR